MACFAAFRNVSRVSLSACAFWQAARASALRRPGRDHNFHTRPAVFDEIEIGSADVTRDDIQNTENQQIRDVLHHRISVSHACD
jgi:hypothetical protein